MAWFKVDADYGEHPKVIDLRARAGPKADSAEVAWLRMLAAAKRYGRWTFASEEHVRHVMGRWYGFAPLLRAVGLLDELTIHDGEQFNGSDRTNAERQRRHRNALRNGDSNGTPAPTVTALEKKREEKTREDETLRVTGVTDPVVAYMRLTGSGRPPAFVEAKLRANAERYGFDEWLFAINQARELYGTRNDMANAESIAEGRYLKRKDEAEERRRQAQPKVSPEQAVRNRAAVQETLRKMTAKSPLEKVT